MDILGIGPLELFFIILIALIIFGPDDIVKTARSLGKFLRNLVTSDGWRAFQQASKGMKDLPTALMREAGLEDEDLRNLTGMRDFEEATKDFEHQISPWTTPPKKGPAQPADPANPWSAQEPDSSETLSETQVEGDVDQEQDPGQQESVPPPADSPFSENIDE